MRHVLANVLTYALVAGLALGSVAFAWVRSEQFVVAREVDVEPREPAEIASIAAFDWFDFGEDVYRVGCRNCHTADGSGRGMYPPVQRMATHLDAEGGRGYLLDVTLYGLHTGTYGAPMPPMPELSDAEVAAVTNYMLTRFAADGGAPEASRLFLPREVAARRGRALTEREVADTRPAVPSARELGRGVRVRLDAGDSAVPEGTDE